MSAQTDLQACSCNPCRCNPCDCGSPASADQHCGMACVCGSACDFTNTNAQIGTERRESRNTAPDKSKGGWTRPAALAAAVAIAVVSVAGCGHVMTMLHRNGAPPPASEFGLGPRMSDQGLYVATLEPSQPLRPRQMQKVRVLLKGTNGNPIEGATILIDGGMPQHGHGLPTQPKVTRAMSGGMYEIEGVRFNMGGWWEFQLAIAGASGTDRVTFNLAL